MTWSDFKDEKKAKQKYQTYEGKEARMLCLGSKVVEKDGDVKMTEEMKKYAEKNHINPKKKEYIKKLVTKYKISDV